jgi:predicted dehydrogenase
VPLSRRDFARLAAAATLLPRSSFAAPAQSVAPVQLGTPPASGRKIRYCVVGLGRISLEHFMPGARQGHLSEITAVVSGHPDKAKRIAAQYNIPESSIYSYETFDHIRDNPNIDAVYIALPNSMHAEYTIRAARAGKHVLCEKPMANSVADCQAMIDACKQANRLLMIAYRCQLEVTTLHARKLVQSGALGKIEAIESANGFNIRPGEWRLNRALAGGGPLMDVGVYSLNACRFLTGEEPIALSAYSSVIDPDGRFTEVEENLAWTMKFPSGAIATCSTSYGTSQPGFIRLHGSNGTLNLDGFGYSGIHLTAHINGTLPGDPGQNVDDLEQGQNPAQFVVESGYFAKCILDGTAPGPSGDEGLRDVALMMQLYASAARNQQA